MITETKSDSWFYAVHTGDGSEPGSLLSASSSKTLEEAVEKGTKDLRREIMIRECDHDWVPWGTGRVPQCSKCKIVDWTE